jgi:hypothetical protein
MHTTALFSIIGKSQSAIRSHEKLLGNASFHMIQARLPLIKKPATYSTGSA